MNFFAAALSASANLPSKSILTTQLSTLGRGMNMVRGTILVIFALPSSATAAVTAPYSGVPGAAIRRSPTSFCTMTVMLFGLRARSIKRMITGVVI